MNAPLLLSDVHFSLWSTELEDVEVTLSSFNMRPNIQARVVFWQDGATPNDERNILFSLTPIEMDALCAKWQHRREWERNHT